jgi:threonine 3-dehydrogenase
MRFPLPNLPYAHPFPLGAGALGQLGAGLTKELRGALGADAVLATDVRIPPRGDASWKSGPFAYCDVLDYRSLESLVVNHRIDWVIHLSALLSAVGEQNVQKALSVNNIGFQNVLELSRIHGLRLFCPSTIGAFGPTTPCVVLHACMPLPLT